jgi:hypothetical protein
MARTIQTIISCDLCNTELTDLEGAARHFANGDSLYEVDLCPEHTRALDEALTPFIAVAKIVDQRKSSMTKRAVGSKPKRDPESTKIREWALGRGIPVNARGRIPADVREQYLAAKRAS